MAVRTIQRELETEKLLVDQLRPELRSSLLLRGHGGLYANTIQNTTQRSDTCLSPGVVPRLKPCPLRVDNRFSDTFAPDFLPGGR